MPEERLEPRSLSNLLSEHTEHVETLANQVYVENGSIILNVDGRYEIELKRCSTEAQLIEWVAHLCEKVWVTPQILRAFILLAAAQGGLDIHRGA
jgi:hypothetical protein